MFSKRRHVLQALGGLVAATTFWPRNAKTQAAQHTFYVATDGDDNAPGTLEQPWASLHKAAQVLQAGDTVYVRGGLYMLTQAIKPAQSGTPEQWITYQNYPGETPILDADAIPVGPWGLPRAENNDATAYHNSVFAFAERPYPPERGAFQIHQQCYLRIQGFTLRNAHSVGFEVRNSHHIDLFKNTTANTFSCGILVDAGVPVDPADRSHHCRIIGNTIVGASNSELQIMHPDFTNHTHAPHEALSIGSVDYFEIAYNQVSYCYKEMIDCKDSARHGLVHHNYIHHASRVGIYVDAWFDDLHDISIYENVIHRCKTGIAIASEGGAIASKITIHNNQIFDNLGTGIIFGIWGKEGWRENIKIYNNTLYRNGYGDGDWEGNNTQVPYWVTGGIYLHSSKVRNLQIQNNIFAANQFFQIGHNQLDSPTTLQQKNIEIQHNLFYEPVDYPASVPLEVWANDVVSAIYGEAAIHDEPHFVAFDMPDLRLRSESPAIGVGPVNSSHAHADLGALPSGQAANAWWAQNFPSQIDPEAVSEAPWRQNV